MKERSPDRGFTLVELIVVIAIISLLSAVVFASIGIARTKARDAQRVVNLNQIANAVAMYQNDSGGVPPGEDGVEYVNGNPEWIPGLVPKYISSVPSDPIDSADHKFHYSRQGNDYEVISFLEREGNDAACGDGGSSCQYYEKASGAFLAIANPGASGWHFSSTTEVVTLPPPSATTTPPSATTTVDTIPPSTPTNFNATAVSTSTINLSWLGSTDSGSANISASGYKVYRGAMVVANVTSSPTLSSVNTISFTASESFLWPATSYTYFIVAYDTAGNTSDPSLNASATTETSPPAVNLPAPTSLRPGFGIYGGVNNWVKTSENLAFSFDAGSLSGVSAFRLYQKKPQDATFGLVAEFSSPSALTPCSAKRTYGTWSLAPTNGPSCPGSAWYISRTGSQPVSGYAVGDYLYYVVAVDASGKEGLVSATVKATFLEPFTIQSPTMAESPVSLTPTFVWPVVSGWPRTPSYWIAVAPSDGTGQTWWSSLSVYGSVGSKVYDGPALDPNKEYTVWIYGHSHNTNQSEDQSSFASGTQTFRVSATSP
ncbi:MAG: hypothetical protein A3C93_06370 [Candidatus Lloydbacteria bacterium RIFCSPHIGHO2_02_FULL_54_17]|uniref:Fibronectin type-III domain-containing protein n=1 Tax=Candidatus Lloydbacteria bacterium RIFCSPHIGHO2_02_FULL_54_17 TaxID=1798664 RepID=A0A1G2DH06_9BACT|nr:MAG: hypothetical protein A2762_01310 [Candidatus Lloydbacteria bacterium RIFCSPHIGHO2_01_FULL_54_11]OGZ12702.1 MAG: hypothetical protein A3C93_06370 [Candidatus Lloydbacteria bacterium RIFCSPHIGHO2_02_FULL_54_17]OGZ13553.1 MAG: hypothetical protein A2948_05030 [Candidatus Lloydbacteria bacterium RIFCSPLOWO2_01_FULL_54_18]